MVTTPQKRMDKTGKMVTRHVRVETPAAGPARALPAPLLAAGAAPSRRKLRPSQRKQQYYSRKMGLRWPDQELVPREEAVTGALSATFYGFEASEAEVYDVLSAVSGTENAVVLLARGVRTAEEARDYLRGKGLDRLITDRTELTQVALERNLSSYDFIENLDAVLAAHPDSGHILDTIEFQSIVSLQEQGYPAATEIAEGNIALSDIKVLGVSRLRRQRKLEHSLAALKEIHTDPNSRITIEDLAWLVGAHPDQKIRETNYVLALEGLLSEGRASMEELRTFGALDVLINIIDSYPRSMDERIPRLIYGAKLFQYTIEPPPMPDIDRLRDEGIDPKTAGEMMNRGMGIEQIIAVVRQDVPIAVSDGWL